MSLNTTGAPVKEPKGRVVKKKAEGKEEKKEPKKVGDFNPTKGLGKAMLISPANPGGTIGRMLAFLS